MSAVQLLTEHLALWSSADTEKKSGRGRASGNAASVYGIKKLRELILELAVRGKLVPQDASDEPASELLKRIEVENAMLVAEGKIKKRKIFPELNEDEKQFELPKGWEWTRLGFLFEIVYGKGLSGSELTEDGYEVFGANGIIGKYSDYLYSESQLLISCRGAYSGKPNISPAFCFITSNSLILENSWKHLNLKFFFYSLTIANKSKIVTGSAQPQVTTTNLDPFIVVLPPLAEQHRIVAKVNELMALCDQLENQHTDAISAHEKLVSYLLDTLTQSQDAADFNENWLRIAANFEMLFTTESSIDALKQTLLQLAVMGKLVPQDESDEPASELLKRIQAEKAKLVADGKIKKSKPLAEIGDDEKPFDLPKRWEWGRFGEISSIKSELVRPEDFQDARQVAPDCIEKGTGRLTEIRTVKESGVKGPNSRFYKGQIVYSKIRPSLSKAVLVDFDGLCSADMYPIDSYIDSKFLLKEILSEVFLEQVRIAENRIKMPKLNQESLTAFVLPIPPLNEQHRIVAKVDELMSLCDTLKSGITAANRLQQKIADVMVEQAVA